MANSQTTPPGTDTPWIAEPSGDGFYRVVNVQGVVLAERCVEEEAPLFATAPELLRAAKELLANLEDAEEDGYSDVSVLRKAIAKAEGR